MSSEPIKRYNIEEYRSLQLQRQILEADSVMNNIQKVVLRLESVEIDTELEIYRLDLVNNRNEFELHSLILKQHLNNFDIDEADRPKIETPIKPKRIVVLFKWVFVLFYFLSIDINRYQFEGAWNDLYVCNYESIPIRVLSLFKRFYLLS